MMQIKGEGTEDIFNGRNTKAARALLPTVLFAVAARKLDAIDAAASVDQLRIPPSNRLEALKGDRTGQHSIRINDAVPHLLYVERHPSHGGRDRGLPLSRWPCQSIKPPAKE